jgi:glutaredoxin-related protein
MKEYFPPVMSNLVHTVISKFEADLLHKKRKIESVVITDTFDFSQDPWVYNETNKHFLKDIQVEPDSIVFLLACRIRKRKGIGLGIYLIHTFMKRNKEKLKGKKVVFLLPGEYTQTEYSYVSKLEALAKKLQVDVRFIAPVIGSEKEKREGLKKYALWDTYVYADIVLYPSIWEGWGNQFIEAVFAKKPIVVFEYPVFITDIKPYNYNVVSLGSTLFYNEDGLATVPQEWYNNASDQLLEILTDPVKQKQIVDHNFEIGKKNHNTLIQLKNHLETIIRT